jgi:PAS domain-containing protein
MYAPMSLLREILSIEDLTARFRAQTELLSSFLADDGVLKKPYASPELPHFGKLSAAGKQEVVQNLAHTLEVFDEVRNEGCSLRDSPQLIWRNLRKLRWTPRSDLFDKIEESDVIEIFSRDHRGLFRNLAFYEILSYPLEELLAATWFELVHRQEEMTQLLFECAGKILSGEIRETTAPEIPEHCFYETRSPELLHFSMKLRLVSPLLADGQVAGFIALHQTCVVGRGPSPRFNSRLPV